MAYTVTITYKAPVAPEKVDIVNPIFSSYVPCNSYVDTEAYAGSVYDTNVEGFGKLDLTEPFATTSFPFPIPFAQFKLATVGEDVEVGDGIVAKQVTFTVDSYQEAFWYMTAGKQVAEQGFTVEVTEETE